MLKSFLRTSTHGRVHRVAVPAAGAGSHKKLPSHKVQHCTSTWPDSQCAPPSSSPSSLVDMLGLLNRDSEKDLAGVVFCLSKSSSPTRTPRTASAQHQEMPTSTSTDMLVLFCQTSRVVYAGSRDTAETDACLDHLVQRHVKSGRKKQSYRLPCTRLIPEKPRIHSIYPR
jgi:hypothetical protein